MDYYAILELCQLARFLASLSCLLVATYSDLKSRIVENKVWVVLVGVSLPFLIWELLVRVSENPTLAIFTLISAALSIILALLVYRLGLFGGADAKAIMALAASLPTYPRELVLLAWNVEPVLKMNLFLPISVLSNAAVLSLVTVLWNVSKNVFDFARNGNLFKNVEDSPLKKAAAFFVAFSVKREELGKYKFYKVVVKEADGKLKFDLSPRSEEIEVPHVERVWITLLLPFMVFMTAGFLLSIFVGDILLTVVHILLYSTS